MDLKNKIQGLFLENLVEEDDQFLKVIKHRREELKKLTGAQKLRAMSRLGAAEKAWKDGNTEQALNWKNEAEDIISGSDKPVASKAANIDSGSSIDDIKMPSSIKSFDAIKSRPEEIMTKVGSNVPKHVPSDGRKLPPGVSIPKPDEDDIDNKPIVGGLATSARGRTESNLLDTEKLFQNIKTNLSRIQGDLPDVTRVLETQPEDLEKFNADYAKIKSEVMQLDAEWNDLKNQELPKDIVKEFHDKVKKLSFKISMYFGNSFYAIKKLKTKKWNFSDVPIKKQDLPTQAPIEPEKPIEAPKASSDDWNKKLNDAGLGDADNPDHDLTIKDRYSDEDNLDEGKYGNIRETIRNCFKL